MHKVKVYQCKYTFIDFYNKMILDFHLDNFTSNKKSMHSYKCMTLYSDCDNIIHIIDSSYNFQTLTMCQLYIMWAHGLVWLNQFAPMQTKNGLLSGLSLKQFGLSYPKPRSTHLMKFEPKPNRIKLPNHLKFV